MKNALVERMILAGVVSISSAGPLVFAETGQPAALAQGYGYPATGYAGQPYAGYGQSVPGYAQSGYGYTQPGSSYGYTQPGAGYGYTQPGSTHGYPGYTSDAQSYAGSYYGAPSSYYGYTQQPGYSYAPGRAYPGYGSSSGFGPLGNAPWDNWNTPDVFGDKSPFQDPFQHEGHWAKRGFRPWRSGPFAYDKWEDHPGTQMPWGNFPGWGDGFFGGFGPDSWEGATPWGSDVPFKWLDPTDPEESIAEIWEDALNAPNRMGRMPPGWTAPYISVPNPIDVENEFERNVMNAPDEIHKMWGGEGAGFGGSPDVEKSESSDKDQQKKENDSGDSGQAEGAAPPEPKG